VNTYSAHSREKGIQTRTPGCVGRRGKVFFPTRTIFQSYITVQLFQRNIG
jgi:hypothetical protein